MAKDQKETKDLSNTQDWMEEYEGQLAIDAYQTEDAIVVKAPIAGVSPENMDISITDEMVTIRGERQDEHHLDKGSFFCQECYWGSFSRSYVLPIAVDADKAQASLKNGILTIIIPKLEKTKTRTIKVKTEL
jgi:HSP20 family protein